MTDKTTAPTGVVSSTELGGYAISTNDRFRLFFTVVDEAMEADFLTPRERTRVILELAYNAAGTEPTGDPKAVEKARRMIVDLEGIPRKPPNTEAKGPRSGPA